MHQQWREDRFLTSLRVILAERMLHTDLCAKSQPSIHDAAEDADFHKLDPDRVGVEGGVAKIKVAYNYSSGRPMHDI